jgi:hypothetical protein
MQTKFGHLQINIHGENAPFYKDLFSFLGWKTLYEGDGFIGVGDANGGSLWFMGGANDNANDYDGRGVNHIGIATESIADVDAAAGYIKEHGVAALFGTPQHRPDFASDDKSTYYQVMFESPDRVLFEVVYTGPK